MSHKTTIRSERILRFFWHYLFYLRTELPGSLSNTTLLVCCQTTVYINMICRTFTHNRPTANRPYLCCKCKKCKNRRGYHFEQECCQRILWALTLQTISIPADVNMQKNVVCAVSVSIWKRSMPNFLFKLFWYMITGDNTGFQIRYTTIWYIKEAEEASWLL